MKTWHPRQINLQKLAGVKSIVGLDITDRHVHVAELKIHRGIVNKFSSRFAVTNYFTCDVADGVSVASSSAAIREELNRHGITSRYAVSALQTGQMRSVRAEVPGDVLNIDEWLQDNFEKLVRIPVPLHELAYRYETQQTGPSSNTVEFVFARKSEVGSMLRFVSALKLDLLALSAGIIDCVNPLIYSAQFKYEEQLSYVFNREDSVTLFEIEEGSVTHSDTVSSITDLPNRERRKMLFAGTTGESGGEFFRPFGVPTEYTLAAGLAIRGFLPELHPIDFMPSTETKIVMERLSRGLFHRVALACGGILLALLLLQSIFSIYVDGFRNEMDARLLASGAGYSELTLLEKQNSSLKNELALIESDTSSTNVAMLLHDVARITPEGVWLYKITMTKAEKRGAVLFISGYSGDSKRIAEFIRLCEREPRLHNVGIVRSGLPVYGENVTMISKKITSPFTFTLSVAAGF
ncbi:MAG: PilN domain-containing protein [Bacteroidetes bacterium]|nr:PilN domain-containing protein [Bacteroidota bacterium]